MRMSYLKWESFLSSFYALSLELREETHQSLLRKTFKSSTHKQKGLATFLREKKCVFQRTHNLYHVSNGIPVTLKKICYFENT